MPAQPLQKWDPMPGDAEETHARKVQVPIPIEVNKLKMARSGLWRMLDDGRYLVAFSLLYFMSELLADTHVSDGNLSANLNLHLARYIFFIAFLRLIAID